MIVPDLAGANADILKYLEESLSVVTESNSSVMREVLADKNVAIETSHLRDSEYADAAE